MQDLPQLTKLILHATDTEWAQEFFILHYREIGGEKANAPSGIRTRDPALRK